MNTSNSPAAPFAPEKINQWFSEMIAALQADRFMLETDVLSEEKRMFYFPMIEGNVDALYSQSRNMSSIYFIQKTLNEYLKELHDRNVRLNKLAFDLSRSKILVWAEVGDDDEETINQLILAEAKTNSDCYRNDFNIATTVVEQSDNIEVPPHYKTADLFKA